MAKQEGLRIVIAGQEKMGKTTLVCGAPDVLLIPLEIGYGGISVPKTDMLQHYAQVDYLLDEIAYWANQNKLPYRSLIFDSATALERHIHQQVLESDPAYNPKRPGMTMDTVLGGYGKAYNLANDIFEQFLKKCDILAKNYHINIIMTCHVFAAKLIDPSYGEYDSWDLLLHSPKNQKTYGKREMITQWADLIGFLYDPIFITKDGNMQRAVSANKGRMLGLSRTPSYTAGNRYNLTGEISIPKAQGWNHLAHALYQSKGIDLYNRNLT